MITAAFKDIICNQSTCKKTPFCSCEYFCHLIAQFNIRLGGLCFCKVPARQWIHRQSLQTMRQGQKVGGIFDGQKWRNEPKKIKHTSSESRRHSEKDSSRTSLLPHWSMGFTSRRQEQRREELACHICVACDYRETNGTQCRNHRLFDAFQPLSRPNIPFAVLHKRLSSMIHCFGDLWITAFLACSYASQ